MYKLEKTGDDEGDDFYTCYVSHLNRSNIASPNEVKDALTDNEVSIFPICFPAKHYLSLEEIILFP